MASQQQQSSKAQVGQSRADRLLSHSEGKQLQSAHLISSVKTSRFAESLLLGGFGRYSEPTRELSPRIPWQAGYGLPRGSRPRRAQALSFRAVKTHFFSSIFLKGVQKNSFHPLEMCS